MAMTKTKVMHGTDGRVWWNGELMSAVKSFEAKITVNKKQDFFNGEYGQVNIYTGYSVSGNYVGHKVDSRVLKEYANALATGIVPELTIIGMVQNPSTGKKERVGLYGVIPDEIALPKFENNETVEEEIPFTADSFKVLDLME